MMTIRSGSPEETEHIGRRLGEICRGGEVIGLIGPLGAGKTCLVRGVAAGLDIESSHVRSPSFTLIAEHRGRLPLFHIDLYRLDTVSIDELWLREYLFGSGVAVVEWFDRLPRPVAEEELQITFRFGDREGRVLTLEPRGAHHRALAETVLHGH